MAQGIQEQTGATGVTVDCPDDIEAKAGDEFECQATSDDGTNATVKVTQNDDQGNVTWAVDCVGQRTPGGRVRDRVP